MAELRIGTCSWKYSSWEGLVYSSSKDIDFLAEYSRKYNTVEVDQWFWSLFKGGKVKLPSPRDVQGYRDAVPEPFRFTVKAPNSITLTHYYQKTKTEPLEENPHFLSVSLFQDFLKTLEPMHSNLGPILFQFEYLNKQKMKSQQAFQERFADFIHGLPTGFSYALELRNANYLNRGYVDFLAATGLSPVLIQGYWMPDIVSVYRKHRDGFDRFETIVIRLHGPDRDKIEADSSGKWNQIIAPKDTELSGISSMIREMIQGGAHVYLNVNNHYEGSAPKTIDRFLQVYG
ncbi:MAG: DUF72 domain-containing protein [Thermodesulfobacteriota bacterium]